MGKTSSLALLALKWIKGTSKCFFCIRINRIKGSSFEEKTKVFKNFQILIVQNCYIQLWIGQANFGSKVNTADCIA